MSKRYVLSAHVELAMREAVYDKLEDANFFLFKENRLTIPSSEEYSVPQLKMMLKKAEMIREISLQEWESL